MAHLEGCKIKKTKVTLSKISMLFLSIQDLPRINKNLLNTYLVKSIIRINFGSIGDIITVSMS